MILDLTECEFLDSSALAALMRAKRRLDRSEQQLALLVTHRIVLRTFEITYLDRYFEIYPSRPAALEGRRSARPS